MRTAANTHQPAPRQRGTVATDRQTRMILITDHRTRGATAADSASPTQALTEHEITPCRGYTQAAGGNNAGIAAGAGLQGHGTDQLNRGYPQQAKRPLGILTPITEGDYGLFVCSGTIQTRPAVIAPYGYFWRGREASTGAGPPLSHASDLRRNTAQIFRFMALQELSD